MLTIPSQIYMNEFIQLITFEKQIIPKIYFRNSNQGNNLQLLTHGDLPPSLGNWPSITDFSY